MAEQTYQGLFLGAGQFAAIQIEGWRDVPGAAITGICNRTRGRAEELAARFDIPHTGEDPGAMMDALKPDFVDVCTAMETHFDMVRLAGDRGIPILCQKPIAPTREESHALVRYCADRDVPLMINDNWRWQAWYREIKQILDAGRIGRPFGAYLAMRTGDGWGPDAYARQPYFREMKRFLLLETGIHYIDTLRYLFGPVQSMYCTVRRRNPEIAGEDQALIVLNFESGVPVIWDANRAAPFPEVRSPFNGFMHIDGSEGVLHAGSDGAIEIEPRNGPRHRHDYAIPPGYRGGSVVAAQSHFIEALRSGVPFETSGHDYLATVDLVFDAYESAETA